MCGKSSLLLALICMSGCQPDRSDRALPMEDGLRTVRVLYSGGSEQVFGPVWDDTPQFLIFEPLVTYEANSCSDIVGGLAARWDHSPDWKTWTIELRPDVRWHDGVPVTSADFAFTIALWKNPDVLYTEAGPVDSIQVLDSLRFRVYLDKPSDWPINGWGTVAYPSHLLKDLDPAKFYEWEFWTRPVGNGPFRYVRHVPETMVELEPNPDYYLGRPSIDRVSIQFKAGGQDQTGVMELLAGNVDMVGLSPIQAGMLEEEPGLNAYYRYGVPSVWLLWNFTDPRFSDLRVRQALAHATDRAELQRVLGFPDGVPVTDGVFWVCDPQNIQAPAPYAYDPERARKLLAEAGWRDSDGDGMLDRNGEPFAFTLQLDRRAVTAAVFVQDQLRRIGIDMKLQVLDGNVLKERFDAGDFESIIATNVWEPQLPVVGMDSPLGVLDRELAQAVAAIDAEPDLDRRLQLWRIAGEQYRDLAPALFLHASVDVLVADARLMGFGEPGTIMRRMTWRHAFGGLEHLWVSDDVVEDPSN